MNNAKPCKAPIKRPRLHLKCEQCGDDIVLYRGQAEWFKDAYAVSLCERCAPGLHQKCSRFHFPPSNRQAAPAIQKLDEDSDPARMKTAMQIADAAAGKLWLSAANGQIQSAELLLELTCKCVSYLQDLSLWHTELLRPTAQTMTAWPFLISRQKRIQSIGIQILDKLQVGKKPLIGGRLYEDSPAQLVAQCLYFWLHKNAQKLRLPPLSQTGLSLWFEVGWRRLLAETKNRPDKHSYTSRIGKSASNHRRAVSRGLPEQTPAMRRSDVTAKIKEVVRNSFMTMLAPLPPKGTPLPGGS